MTKEYEMLEWALDVFYSTTDYTPTTPKEFHDAVDYMKYICKKYGNTPGLDKAGELEYYGKLMTQEHWKKWWGTPNPNLTTNQTP